MFVLCGNDTYEYNLYHLPYEARQGMYEYNTNHMSHKAVVCVNTTETMCLKWPEHL